MVAEARLHDIAHLALREGVGRILKLLHHRAGGEGVARGIGGAAGVLAVLVGKLGEVGGEIVARVAPELFGKLLGKGLLFGLLLVAQRLARGGVLGGEQDVVGRDVALVGSVDGEVLVGGVQRAALGLIELIEILIKVIGAGDALVGLAAQAELGELGGKALLAAVLLDEALLVGLDGGLLLVGERHAVLLGEIFDDELLLDGGEHVVFDVVGHGRAVGHGVAPVERAAAVILHIRVEIRGAVADPIGDQVGGRAVAVHGGDDCVGRNAAGVVAHALLQRAGGEAVRGRHAHDSEGERRGDSRCAEE